MMNLSILLCLFISSIDAFTFVTPQRRYSNRLAVKFNSFDDLLATYTEPILVDFAAEWCGPCKLMSAELKKLSDDEALKGVMKIAKIDVDKHPALGEQYKIEGFPTTILFAGGEEKHRFVGLVTAEQILYELSPYLKKN